jgi:hypothetical protein
MERIDFDEAVMSVGDGELMVGVPSDVRVGEGVSVVHYLQLFPERVRKALLSKYKLSPSFSAVIDELIAAHGDGYDRSGFSYQASGGQIIFLKTDIVGANWYRFYELLRDMNPLHYELPVMPLMLKRDPANGFCYLNAMAFHLRVPYGVLLGPSPYGKDLDGILDSKTRVSVAGGIAHIPPTGGGTVVTLDSLGPTTRVGGQGCGSYGLGYFSAPVCVSCSTVTSSSIRAGPIIPSCATHTSLTDTSAGLRAKKRLFSAYPLVSNEHGEQVLNSEIIPPMALFDTVALRSSMDDFVETSDDRVRNEMLAAMQTRGWQLPNAQPCRVVPCREDDAVDYSYVHNCGGVYQIVMDYGRWAFELEPGEKVFLAGVELSANSRPLVVVGEVAGRFLYSGHRTAVVRRSFSHHAWVRLMHNRFRVGYASTVSRVMMKTEAACLLVPSVSVGCEDGLVVGMQDGLKGWHYRQGTGDYAVGPFAMVETSGEGYLRAGLWGNLFDVQSGAKVDICGGMCVAYPGAKVMVENGCNGNFSYRIRALEDGYPILVGLARAQDSYAIDDGGPSGSEDDY